MQKSTYYNLNLVEGTDLFNPLVQDVPNYETIDEQLHQNAIAGVTLANELVNGNVHALTRSNSDCAVIRFIATGNWKQGDTMTVDGVQVTVLLPNGETAPNNAYVINANVLGILTGTVLTLFVSPLIPKTADDVSYTSGQTVKGKIEAMDGQISTNANGIVSVNQRIDALGGGAWTLAGEDTYTPTSTGIVYENNREMNIAIPSNAKEVLVTIQKTGNVGGYMPIYKGFSAMVKEFGNASNNYNVFFDGKIKLGYCYYENTNVVTVKVYWR